MGQHYPNYPVDTSDGDDPTFSPQKGQNSLLAALKGTQSTRRLLVDPDGGLLVHSTNGETVGSPVNVFSEVDAMFATETTILTYTVPAGMTLSLTTVIGWGDNVGEFLVRVDGVLRGGGRTSAATLTLDLPYDSAPIIANAGQVVTVTITHYAPATRHFRANMLGGLN